MSLFIFGSSTSPRSLYKRRSLITNIAEFRWNRRLLEFEQESDSHILKNPDPDSDSKIFEQEWSRKR